MHASPDPRHAEPRPAPYPPQELRTFFASLLGASRGTDPIIESGNKYGKTDVSHRMNGELLMHECKASERVKALTAADRARMVEMLEVVLLNPNPNAPALTLTLIRTPNLTHTLTLTLTLTRWTRALRSAS